MPLPSSLIECVIWVCTKHSVPYAHRCCSALGKSMGATFRDPCVFNEPGTDDFYIIAGVFNYFVTKLGKDMVSLAETPKLVNFTNHVYGPCGDGKTDDKPFMHKNGDTYYLSWGW